MRACLPISLFAMLASVPALANEPETMSSPTDADYATAANVVQPLLNSFKAEQIDQAIDRAFSENPMIDQVKGQLPVLIGQITTIMDIYGPIETCELANRNHVGSMFVRLTYVCQHERFLTLWNFRVAETGNGWVISQVDFKDVE